MTPLLSLRGTIVPKQSPGRGMRLPHPDKSGLAMTKRKVLAIAVKEGIPSRLNGS